MQPEQNLPPLEPQHTHAVFDDALNALKPEAKSSRHRSLKDDVRSHYNQLLAAHQKGHTWSRLATLFEECLGRPIAPETLRKYIAQIRAERDQTSLPLPKRPAKPAAIPKKLQGHPADAFNYPGGDRK